MRKTLLSASAVAGAGAIQFAGTGSRRKAIAGVAGVIAAAGVVLPAVAHATPAASVSITAATAPVPATVNGITMTPLTNDPTNSDAVDSSLVGPSGAVGFSPSITHLQRSQIFGDGGAWDSTHATDFYGVDGFQGNSETITLPTGTAAFVFDVSNNWYGQPFTVTATTDDGATKSMDVTDALTDLDVAQVVTQAAPGQALKTITVTGSSGAGLILGNMEISTVITSGTQQVTEQVNPGQLGFVSVPGAVTPPPVQLTGLDQVSGPFTLPLDVSDATGSGTGWNVSLATTPFTNAAGKTIAGPLLETGEGAVTCDNHATCTASTDVNKLVASPLSLVSNQASIVQVADANTGMGNQAMSPSFTLAVPANNYAGTFTSTWTVTLGSGPSAS